MAVVDSQDKVLLAVLNTDAGICAYLDSFYALNCT